MYFVHPQIKFSNLNKLVSVIIEKENFEILSKKLSFYFPGKQFIFTDMGRSAFKLLIEKFNLENSEILMPAFICDIFYPILKQYNVTPIFLDIDLKTFHIKIDEIKQKIIPTTEAILACHTYGLPVDVQKIREVTNNQLLIIEDCAHSFGAKINGVFTGNSGDASFFSLYKQFPTLRGGLAIFEPRTSNFEQNLLTKTYFDLRDLISLLNYFSPFAFFFKEFGGNIAPKMIRKEKKETLSGINRISLNLFSNFLEDFKKSLQRRIELALYFQEELKKLGFEVQESKGSVFCYLSALVPKNLIEKRNEIVKQLRKYNIFCTRIWHTPIILNKEVQKEYKINLAEFPNTIEAAKRIINFPLQNYYTEKDIKEMISSIEKVILKL